jgi:hypothetical protein
MVFKKLHLGITNFTPDTLSDIVSHLSTYYSSEAPMFPSPSSSSNGGSNKSLSKGKRMETQSHTKLVRDAIAAIALCHNVTPVVEGDTITYLFLIYRFLVLVHSPLSIREVVKFGKGKM